jgi:hypothetical protein
VSQYQRAIRRPTPAQVLTVLLPPIVALVSFLAVNWHRAVENYAMAGGAAGNLPSWLLSMPMYGMIPLWLTVALLISRHKKSPLFAIRQP